jgi:hypothetical protein
MSTQDNDELREAIATICAKHMPNRLLRTNRYSYWEMIDELIVYFTTAQLQLQAEAELQLRKDNDFIRDARREAQLQLVNELIGELPKKVGTPIIKGREIQVGTGVARGHNSAIDQITDLLEHKKQELGRLQ